MSPGPTQLIIVLVIVLLLFGAKKIPELAKGLGAGMHEFRKGASGEIEDEDSDSEKDTSSESRDKARSDDSSSDEGHAPHDSQNADKTEQRS